MIKCAKFKILVSANINNKLKDAYKKKTKFNKFKIKQNSLQKKFKLYSYTN